MMNQRITVVPGESGRTKLFELINRRAQILESLHRHLTMLSSTLLGILAVFGGAASERLMIRWLTGLGALSLFLSLLSGIYCIWQYYRIHDRSVKLQVRRYLEEGAIGVELVRFPKLYETAAIFCPAIFCVGVLFLLAGVILRLSLFQS